MRDRRRSFLRRGLWCLASVSLLSGADSAAAFTEGDVFLAPTGCTTPCGLRDVTAGGGQTAGDVLAPTFESFGQIAWSSDLSTLYVTEYSASRVVEVSGAGVASPYATGIPGATGLLRLADGRLLAVSFSAKAVYDVTGGGDFSAATPIATGFQSPRNLVQLESGAILLADQGSGLVLDITSGGDFTGASGFAYGLTSGPYDVVQDGSGSIYTSTRHAIYDITSGGDQSGATAFATGLTFVGLAVDAAGRLLVSTPNSSDVYDITAGGNFFGATPFSQGMSGFGDTGLDALPATTAVLPVPAVRPWHVVLAALGVAATMPWLKRHAAARAVPNDYERV